MRLLPLLLVFVAVSAQAQTTFDPQAAINRLGAPWAEAKTVISAPDSGRVVGKTGDLLFLSPDTEVTRILLSVRGGRLMRFTATASESGRQDLEDLDAEFRREVGPPGADGFYSWEQIRGVGAPTPFPLAISIDVEAGVMVLHAVLEAD